MNSQQILYCVICGNKLKPYQIKRNIITCCRSCAMKRRYQNPENRLAMSNAMKKAFEEHPEYAQKQSIAQTERLKSQTERQKISIGLKKSYKEHPEYKEARSKSMKQVCANAEYREQLSRAVKAAHEQNPEYRKRKSDSQKKRFNNAKERQKISKSVIKTLRAPQMHKILSKAIKHAYELHGKEIQAKALATKKKNGTLNISKTELEGLELLRKVFDDVKYQYMSNVYPFRCDYYVPSLDLYIEGQFDWRHGNRPFDKNDSSCLEQLHNWQEKAKTSKNYINAINTWTVRDTNKRKIAKANNLNYVEIFTIEELKVFLEQRTNK